MTLTTLYAMTSTIVYVAMLSYHFQYHCNLKYRFILIFNIFIILISNASFNVIIGEIGETRAFDETRRRDAIQLNLIAPLEYRNEMHTCALTLSPQKEERRRRRRNTGNSLLCRANAREDLRRAKTSSRGFSYTHRDCILFLYG